jgi:hypothetical protein
VKAWADQEFCAMEERVQKNNLNMSGRLYKKLSETDDELCERLDSIREKTIELWNKGQYPRPLTEHGESHIGQVEDNLDVLTRPLKKQSSENTHGDLRGALNQRRFSSY